MSSYWSSIVHQLTPYVPGEQPRHPRLIKLNTNENPYGPSPMVLDALKSEVADSLRLYPDPNAECVKEAVAGYYAQSPEKVFVGNGSDEVLAHTFQALLKHAQPLLFPDITYSFYPVYCGLYGVDYETVPLTEEFAIEPDDFIRPNGGILFPNPNAPTGRLLSLSSIEKILKHNTRSVVVVDEAYVDFGGDSAISLLDGFSNLLVIQTLSKSRALAGLRVGFAVGDSALIEGLERVKNSFNSYPLSRFALAGAAAAMKDRAYFEETRKKIIFTRDVLAANLERLGFQVIPSAANFVFARHPARDAGQLALRLRERGIIVRHFKQPRIDQYLRITVGTNEQCDSLIETLEEFLGE